MSLQAGPNLHLPVFPRCSFELNSEVLADDEPLLSISNRFPEGSGSLCDNLSPRGSLGVSEGESSNLQYTTQWNHGSTLGEQDVSSNLSEQQIEGTDLEKELLSQQCRELREELDVRDRDLNVLRQEVIQNEEELEEARNRWSLAPFILFPQITTVLIMSAEIFLLISVHFPKPFTSFM